MGQTNFPRYMTFISGQPKFLSLKEAAEAYYAESGNVSLGEWVLAENYTLRPLTKADEQLISNTANKIRSKQP